MPPTCCDRGGVRHRLGLDHGFLLTPEAGVPTDPLARIAFEKASIAKPACRW
jgi:hypothetical protein